MTDDEDDHLQTSPSGAPFADKTPSLPTASLPLRREEGPYTSALSGRMGEHRISPGGGRISGVADDEQPISLEAISWPPNPGSTRPSGSRRTQSQSKASRPVADASTLSTTQAKTSIVPAQSTTEAQLKKPALHFPAPAKVDDWVPTNYANVSPTPAPHLQVQTLLSAPTARVKEMDAPPRVIPKRLPQENAVASSSRVQLPPSKERNSEAAQDIAVDRSTDLLAAKSPHSPRSERGPTTRPQTQVSTENRLSRGSIANETSQQEERQAVTSKGAPRNVNLADLNNIRSVSRSGSRREPSRIRRSLLLVDLEKPSRASSTRLSSPMHSSRSRSRDTMSSSRTSNPPSIMHTLRAQSLAADTNRRASSIARLISDSASPLIAHSRRSSVVSGISIDSSNPSQLPTQERAFFEKFGFDKAMEQLAQDTGFSLETVFAIYGITKSLQQTDKMLTNMKAAAVRSLLAEYGIQGGEDQETDDDESSEEEGAEEDERPDTDDELAELVRQTQGDPPEDDIVSNDPSKYRPSVRSSRRSPPRSILKTSPSRSPARRLRILPDASPGESSFTPAGKRAREFLKLERMGRKEEAKMAEIRRASLGHGRRGEVESEDEKMDANEDVHVDESDDDQRMDRGMSVDEGEQEGQNRSSSDEESEKDVGAEEDQDGDPVGVESRGSSPDSEVAVENSLTRDMSNESGQEDEQEEEDTTEILAGLVLPAHSDGYQSDQHDHEVYDQEQQDFDVSDDEEDSVRVDEELVEDHTVTSEELDDVEEQDGEVSGEEEGSPYHEETNGRAGNSLQAKWGLKSYPARWRIAEIYSQFLPENSKRRRDSDNLSS